MSDNNEKLSEETVFEKSTEGTKKLDKNKIGIIALIGFLVLFAAIRPLTKKTEEITQNVENSSEVIPQNEGISKTGGLPTFDEEVELQPDNSINQKFGNQVHDFEEKSSNDDNAELVQAIKELENENNRLKREREAFARTKSVGVGTATALPAKSPYDKFINDQDFGKLVAYMSQNVDEAWTMKTSEVNKLLKVESDYSAQVEDNLENLFDKITYSTLSRDKIYPAGSRIIARTKTIINTDHPHTFEAVVTAPRELRGAKILGDYGSNRDGRVPINIQKMVLPNGKSTTINGSVAMKGLPGFEGKIKSRAFARIGPSLIDAGVAGGLMAWQMQNEVDSLRIDSRDQVYAPIITNGVTGLSNEIKTLVAHKTVDRITVPINSQFTIMLLDELKVTL